MRSRRGYVSEGQALQQSLAHLKMTREASSLLAEEMLPHLAEVQWLLA
jgi:hypothetical protein